MNDIDDEIRRGLTAATDPVDGIEAQDLSRRLAARRAASDPHDPRRARGRGARHRRLGIASVAAVAALIGGAVWWNGDDGDRVQVEVQDDRPASGDTPGGWDAWEPGWHELDTGPVPATIGASLAELDGNLVVAGFTYADGIQTSSAYTFDPTAREWTQLPVPPLATISIVAAGDTLVAVGEPPSDVPIVDPAPRAAIEYAWATWRTGDAEWTAQGTFAVAAPLRTVGALGPSPLGGGAYLLWTGERIVDVTHGAVLGLAGEHRDLEFPADIVSYTHLLSGQPVWTGDHLILTTWSAEPGISWNAFGEIDGEVPLLPDELTEEGGIVRETSAVSIDGDLALFSLDDEITRHNGVVLDAGSGQWTILPDLPMTASWCRQGAVIVAGEVLIDNCRYETNSIAEEPLRPLRLHGGAWESIGESPHAEPCCMRTFLGTDGAFIVWSTSTDTQNDPAAPSARGTVWIPPRGTTR